MARAAPAQARIAHNVVRAAHDVRCRAAVYTVGLPSPPSHEKRHPQPGRPAGLRGLGAAGQLYPCRGRAGADAQRGGAAGGAARTTPGRGAVHARAAAPGADRYRARIRRAHSPAPGPPAARHAGNHHRPGHGLHAGAGGGAHLCHPMADPAPAGFCAAPSQCDGQPVGALAAVLVPGMRL
ncbi:hypothetical protein D3C72_1371350 [compost metagenome]